jgi:hypothetical protein
MVTTLLVKILCAGAVAAVAVLPAAADAASNSHTISGTYMRLAAEPAGSTTAHATLDVVVSGTKTHRIDLKGRSIKPGTNVKVKGSRKTTVSALEVSSVETTGTTTEASVDTTHQDRALVILATWTTPDALTPEQARRQMFVDGHAWFAENSYGAYGLTGDVTPWVTIAGPAAGQCFADMGTTMLQATSAATALGFDATAYDRTIVYFPRQLTGDCAGYAGWAYQPGKHLWLNGAMDRRTTTHELGHNLGLDHAHSYYCMTPGGLQLSLADTGCSNDEYGDAADTMGGSNASGHVSTFRKQQLGWAASARIADLSAGGTVTLAPLASRAGTVGAKVVTATRTYWFEHRTKTGVDSLLPDGQVGGVLVRVADTTIAPGVGLLDMTPNSAGRYDDAQLSPGATWTAPDGKRFTVGQAGAAGVSLTVSTIAAPAAPAPAKAAVKTTTLTVTWSAPVDDGGAAVSSYVVTLSNGTTRTVGSTVRSAAFTKMPNGLYVATVQAVNTVGRSLGATTAQIQVGRLR